MPEGQNKRLEERLDGLGEAMYALGDVVDENLRTILLAMTTERAVTDSLALRSTTPYQDVAMDLSLIHI